MNDALRFFQSELESICTKKTMEHNLKIVVNYEIEQSIHSGEALKKL